MRNPPRVNILLSIDDTKNFVDLFVLLIAIDKRVTTRTRTKAKKNTKAKTKRKEIGSRLRALFFIINRITPELLKSLLF